MTEVAGGQGEFGGKRFETAITRWLVKVGDWVKRDQDLAHISTDLVDFGLPSPRTGRVVKLLIAEGETIPAGSGIDQLLIIEDAAPRP